MDVEMSWLSASCDNLQDVRELIPEFYYCSEFLRNHDDFDFGVTQKGQLVNHVKVSLTLFLSDIIDIVKPYFRSPMY